LVQQYQESSVYVLTSLYELESMTTLEAMACGCPILIADSEYSAATYFVKDNGYLFDPQDPKDLAEKIYSLSKDQKALTHMREKSITQSKDFAFNTSIKKMVDFFSSFIS